MQACRMTKYEPFKDVFKDRNRKFTLSISRTYIFITQSLFNERLSVAGYTLQTLLTTFQRKDLRIQVSANIPWIIFCLWWNCNYSERLIFVFAIFALHISNMLMVQKEELFIKSPKLQINHAHNNKLKSRSF